jgi:hypothetical protein
MQAAELVQERMHREQLGAGRRRIWLRSLRLADDRPVPANHQLNSDAAQAAIAVVTVHRSKGLDTRGDLPLPPARPGGDQGGVAASSVAAGNPTPRAVRGWTCTWTPTGASAARPAARTRPPRPRNGSGWPTWPPPGPGT